MLLYTQHVHTCNTFFVCCCFYLCRLLCITAWHTRIYKHVCSRTRTQSKCVRVHACVRTCVCVCVCVCVWKRKRKGEEGEVKITILAAPVTNAANSYASIWHQTRAVRYLASNTCTRNWHHTMFLSTVAFHLQYTNSNKHKTRQTSLDSVLASVLTFTLQFWLSKVVFHQSMQQSSIPAKLCAASQINYM